MPQIGGWSHRLPRLSPLPVTRPHSFLPPRRSQGGQSRLDASLTPYQVAPAAGHWEVASWRHGHEDWTSVGTKRAGCWTSTHPLSCTQTAPSVLWTPGSSQHGTGVPLTGPTAFHLGSCHVHPQVSDSWPWGAGADPRPCVQMHWPSCAGPAGKPVPSAESAGNGVPGQALSLTPCGFVPATHSVPPWVPPTPRSPARWTSGSSEKTVPCWGRFDSQGPRVRGQLVTLSL